eukprot:4323732-Alexandrium_andersonii.AAC.1
MAHPPDARASADANSGAAIGIHAKAGGETKVQGDGNYAHTFRGTFSRCPPARPRPSSAR